MNPYIEILRPGNAMMGAIAIILVAISIIPLTEMFRGLIFAGAGGGLSAAA